MDSQDYLKHGFIGMPTGSYSHLPIKDLGSGSYSWDDAYSTARATRDAHIHAVNDLILSLKVMYLDNTTPGEYRYTSIPVDVGITPQGKIDFIDSANDVRNKMLDFIRNQIIFWNQIIHDKHTGTHSETISYIPAYTNYWGNGPSASSLFEYVTITINFDDYPTMTREIYENYINSLKDYMFALKTFLKIATNSDLEIVNLPIDFTIPYLPPST